MSTRRLAFLCLLCSASPLLHAQAKHAAERLGDLQIGAGFVVGKSDYGPHLLGGDVYVDFDRTSHWGGEFVVHQANASGGSGLYERTYEIGPRYTRHYGPASPYAKVMIGRGVFNFPGYYNTVTKNYGPSPANLAYNMYAVGAGSDLRVLDHLNVRLDYEYQRWAGFPTNGLTPQLVTVGVAYHFRSDKIGFGRH
ncbi:Outer membrane protein beta-barrel domain-containing protein [Granulicella rosea]|uniref:Outer membrane protein beta-barrel domain-containing protein n=1 Tax=Granulicella rosea TaxID=474952 RepID=A0A239MB04_9BACT|nr:outer membrane beta-barrel protein [Granulicella rosea]SNT39283.1 Outer membrane protein beta-barrel domain-containing protein [Granulicella rosea]